MALSVHNPQQEEHNQELPSSWRKKNSIKKRHSSAPPQQRVTASTAVLPDAQRSLFHHLVHPDHRHHHEHHEHHEHPTVPQQSGSKAITTPVAVATTPTPTGGDSSSSGGPLSFPKPRFSAALKVVEDAGFTLVSRATGRRWMAVNSSRKCQFGEVLRAVELTEDATAPLRYVAIKVILSP